MRTEAPFRHGTPQKTAVLLVNLGTPDAPDAPSLRRYLREFLSDPRVVEIPRLVWWMILNLFILPFRPKKSAAKYATVWTEKGSPLLAIGHQQVARLCEGFKDRRWEVKVELAMRYGNPSVASKMDELRAAGYDRVLVFPLYPQYAAATTASVMDAVFQWAAPVRNLPELRFVKHYHDHPAYIHALADSVLAHWRAHGRPNFDGGDVLLMSFHGVPEFALLKGDPYHCECHKTGRLLAEALGLEKSNYRVTFQSRFGKAKWLEPYTDATLKALGQAGTKRIDVICPGFMADCLETLEEINQEGREDFLHAGGGEFHYIACLNDSDGAAAMLSEIVAQHLQGWPVDMGYEEAMAAELAASRRLALAMGARDGQST
ncbi:MAG TPA: ferrochelatase [Limnobacter sp.]|uniref:ferrochelatase n=1 Tax=Limnobacter sp. TaxID=2003368 RepID=UPI002ED9D6AF